jgi:outer membrane immunogenic protein
MRKLAFLFTALAFNGSAFAADLPVKAPPPVPVPVYDWTGFYLGGYYGAAWSQSHVRTPGDTANPGSVEVNNTGWTAGVTAGYNLQLSPVWLVGVEGDFGYLGGGQLFQEFNDPNIDAGEQNHWYATLRGRLGYVTGPSLIYVTGGVGFVHLTDTFGGSGSQFPLTPGVSNSTTTEGGVVGAGVETKLSRNWSAKTEYLYIDGGSDHTFMSNTFSSFTAATPTAVSHSAQVIKTGLNYRFDGDWDGLPFFAGQTLASNHVWNGFYAGGNAGIGTSLTHIHSSDPVAGVFGDANINGTGFAGGGEAGYNYMLWQKYLVGVEGDFGALAINGSVSDWNDAEVVFSQKTSWYGTLRGRIGVSTGPALLYLTGGAAWVNLQDGVLPIPGSLPAGSVSSKSGTGWTWGGGTEVALDQHWSAKLESLYVNSGSSMRLIFPPTTFGEFKESFVIVRFGLNYAFN